MIMDFSNFNKFQDVYYRTHTQNLGELEQLEMFYTTLCTFLEKHDVEKTVRLDIFTKLCDNSNCAFYDVIAQSFLWSGTKKGYDFYYFLNLRWVVYLYYSQDLFNLFYSRSEAHTAVNRYIKFSDEAQNGYPLYDLHKKRYERIINKLNLYHQAKY